MCLSTLNHGTSRAKFHTNGGPGNQIPMLHDLTCKNFADMNFSLQAQFSLDCKLLFARVCHMPNFPLFIPFGCCCYISPFCCWRNWQNFTQLTRCARRFVLQYLLNFYLRRIFDNKRSGSHLCNLSILEFNEEQQLMQQNIMFPKTCRHIRPLQLIVESIYKSDH